MTPLLSLEDIHKRFPGVYALKGVDFEVLPGEVHALVGENGAGKSTLIKIAAGVYSRDQGRYQIAGRPVDIRHPRQALDHGLAVVYQELELVPSLSVAENLFFGRLPHGRGGRVQWNALYNCFHNAIGRGRASGRSADQGWPPRRSRAAIGRDRAGAGVRRPE